MTPSTSSSSAHLRPPPIHRAASSSSNRSHNAAPPVQPPPPGRAEAGPLAIDSGDPVIGDMLYRLDDEQRAPPPAASEDTEQQTDSSSAPPPVDPLHDHLAWIKDRPWYRRPNEWWLIPLTTILAVASGSIMSSKVELFNQIVCEELASDAARNALGGGVGTLRFPHERPPVTNACLKNPDVAAGSADLQMKITITMGILSAITTGWWGGLSDRRGRTKVLGAAVGGFLMADLSYLAIGLLPVASLPFGSHFMIISSVVEGLLGGIATMIAGHQGFISDVTPAGTRAKSFAQLSGCFYLGLTVGPALGGWMAKATDSLMSTFVFATSAHLLYILLILFVVPESVSPERKRSAMAEYKRQTAATATSDSAASSVKLQLRRRLLAPLLPMAMLLPRQVDEVEKLQSRPATPMPSLSELRRAAQTPSAPSSSHISVSHISRKRTRDWNLTWLSLSYFLAMSCMGLMTVKAVYAQEVFGWDAATLGLYLTAISVSRVVALTLVLPVVIKILHRPPRRVVLPQDAAADETTGLLLDDEGRVTGAASAKTKSYGAVSPTSGPSSASSRAVSPLEESSPLLPSDDEDATNEPWETSHHSTVEELWTLRAKHLRLLHDSHFDLKLTRASFAIDAIAYGVLCLWRTPAGFVTGSILVSLGAASSASMASLALALLQRPDEAGRLFGAWSIVSAIGSTVLGPLFFTKIFKAYAHTAPHAIFFAGEAVLLAALACTLFIRVRRIKSLPGLPPRPRSTVRVGGQE